MKFHYWTNFHATNKKGFVYSLRLTGTFAKYIPGGCAWVLQPCDMGVMRSFKGGMKQNKRSGQRQNIFTWPARLEILFKLENMWLSGDSTHGIAFLKLLFKISEQMGLAHSVVSPPPTLYPATPLRHINDNMSDTDKDEHAVLQWQTLPECEFLVVFRCWTFFSICKNLK